MKPTLASCLFFCFLYFGFAPQGESQAQADSLAYYVSFIEDPKQNTHLFEAISYLQRENIGHRQNDHTLGVVYNLIYIASAQRKIGLFFEAERAAVEALELLDTLADGQDPYRITLYNFLGILYYDYEDYDNALRSYQKVLDLDSDQVHRATTTNNIGNIYKERQDYATAILYYEQSYEASLLFNSPLNKARALDNLGFAQSQGNDPNALNNLEAALKIREQLNFQSGIVTSYLHLGAYYKDRQNKVKALDYANRAVAIAEAHNNNTFKKAALTFLTDLSDDTSVVQLNDLNAALERDAKLQRNDFAGQRYNMDRANAQINSITLAKERHQRQSIIAIALGLLVLVSALFYHVFLKAKHKKEKLEQVYLTESRISKQIHDDVSNDLFQVMTKLESKTEIGEDLKDELHSLYYRTRDISKEHSLINREYPFLAYIGELIESFNDANTSIIVKGVSDIAWETVDDLKLTTIYKVLQELLINMRKHSRATLVVIIFKKNNKKIQLNYSDNGIGCDLIKNTGLQNTENRIQSINGIITFETKQNQGFKSKISIH